MGRLQVRITLAIILLLVPLLIIFTWIDIRGQRSSMQDLLEEKVDAIASSGARTIGRLWEQAIATGQLTQEQVFDLVDTGDVPFEEGQTGSEDKYHTAYDVYVEEHWQVLLDDYLVSDDILYAAPMDRGGYWPTDNQREASKGDDSQASRAKRVFDDPASQKAAQHVVEKVLRQEYVDPVTDKEVLDASVPIYVNGEHWGAFRVGIELAQQEAREMVAFWRTAGGAFVIAAMVVLFAWWGGRHVAGPIAQLTEAATRAARGQLDQRVDIPSQDEFGILADAFNTMAGQLGGLITNLEARVAERTEELRWRVTELEASSRQSQRRAVLLEASAEVAHVVASMLDPDRLLGQVVQLISERFGHYHTGVFLLDETHHWAVLRAASSEGGQRMLTRGHRLEVGQQGIIGYVTSTGRPRIALDVGADAVYFDNPDLPQTRSEVGLPLITRGQLIGALDVQSTQEAAFDDEDITVLSSLADQIATALDNAHLYEASQSALARLEAVQRRYAGEVWGEQIARYETDFYEYRVGGPIDPLTAGKEDAPGVEKVMQEGGTAVQVGGDRQVATLATPIRVRGGHVIGALGLQKEGLDMAWSSDQVALVETVAAQVAQAMEAVHLIDETRRYAERERLVAEITAKIRSAPDMGSILRIAVQEIRRALGVSHGYIRLGTETHLRPPVAQVEMSEAELEGQEPDDEMMEPDEGESQDE